MRLIGTIRNRDGCINTVSAKYTNGNGFSDCAGCGKFRIAGKKNRLCHYNKIYLIGFPVVKGEPDYIRDYETAR